jgi:hypothetical protein
MAAEGMSNREIAQALFVTLRTVEMHLSNAFRKLDVSSRTQLPRPSRRAKRPSPPAPDQGRRSFLRSPHVVAEPGSAHSRPIAYEGGIDMTELAHRRNHDFDVALYRVR